MSSALLADQQAALRRIATLVARGAAPSEVFSAVAEELARCLGVTHANLVRYEADGGGGSARQPRRPGVAEEDAGR